MMIRKFFILYLILIIQGCDGQPSSSNAACNRKVADKSIARQLPKGICIPENYSVDQLTILDYNRDKKFDAVVRYSDFPLLNGDQRFYGIYERVNDSAFVFRKQFENIYPPYLTNIYAAASSPDSTLENFLVNTYPYSMQLEFIQDTIKLSHLIPEFYGKTYEFVFEKPLNNWYLKRIKYWIGGLDVRDVERMDLVPKLVNRNVVEIRKPNTPVSIDDFNLPQSRKIAYAEEREYFTNAYNLFDWSKKNK